MDARYMWMPTVFQHGPFPLVSPPPDSQICTGTGLAPNHICAGTRLTPPHFAPGPARPAPALVGPGLAEPPALICTRAWLLPPTSAPGLNAAPHAVHVHRDWTQRRMLLVAAGSASDGLAPPTLAKGPGTAECCPVQIAPQMANASCMLLCTPNQGRPPVLPRGLFPP
jgi:hypothetical protein